MSTNNQVRLLRIITRMNIGGPSRQVAVLADLEGFDTLTVIGNCSPEEAEDKQCVQALENRMVRIQYLRRNLHPVQDFLAFLELIRVIRRFRPQIVHTHTAKAGMLGRLAAWITGVPILVHTYHGHVLEGYFRPQVTAFFRKLERWLGKHSDALITLSRQQFESITHQHHIGDSHKNRIIPLGLPLTEFLEANGKPDSDWYARRGVNPSTLFIVWAGRITGIKNPMLIPEIARMLQKHQDLPDWQILVAGDGEMREELQQAILLSGMENRVSLLGWEQDILSLCRATDIALLTSFQEGTPVSLIEAMASGAPIVATRVGGVEDITGSAGLLSESGDARMLADHLTVLLRDSSLRSSLGESGRKQAQQFTASRLKDDLRRMYRELISGKDEG